MANSTNENRSLLINTTYLGAIKQVPPLCRSLRQKAPEHDIYISCSDFVVQTGKQKVLESILRRDLAHNGIPQNGIHHGERPIGNCLSLELNVHNGNHHRDYATFSTMSLGIDPLKFQKRKLLSKDKIKKLREKYGLFSDNIILGGSLTVEEGERLIYAGSEVIKARPNTQIVLVPRSTAQFKEVVEKNVLSAIDKRLEDMPYIKIISELGILDKLYALCDVAVIGDTLESGRGQNPLEPAFYGKPMLWGGFCLYNNYAFRGLERTGLLRKAGEYNSLVEALSNPLKGTELEVARSKTKEFIDSMQGAADVYADIIHAALDNRQVPRELALKANDFLEENFKRWIRAKKE